MAEALAYAHGQGIVHRDVKPDNMMLDAAGRIHLMDFGLAARQDEAARLTNDGAVMGTPSYMAPEQAGGNSAQAGPKADQYAAGVVLYELLTGKLPFEGSIAVVLHNVVHTPPDPPSSLRPGLPKDLETVCQKAMAKRIEDRYVDCQALADDLRRWLDGEPILARRLGWVERLTRWGRRNRLVAGLTVAVATSLLLGIGVAILFAARASQQAQRADREAKSARDALGEAETAQARAEAARNETLERVVRLHIRTGNAASDPLAALHSYTAAWQADRDDPDRNFFHQVRLGHALLMTRRLNAVHFAPTAINFQSFDPDSRFVLSYGTKANYIRVWDAATGRLRYAPLEHDSPVARAAFDQSGARIFALTAGGSVRVWDAQRGTPVGSPLGVSVVAADLSPAGDSVALAVRGRRAVQLYAMPEGTLLKEWSTPEDVTAVRFGPTGDRVIASLSRTALLWDVAASEPLATIPHRAPPHAAGSETPTGNPFGAWYPLFNPDGRVLATLILSGKGFRLWDGRTGKALGPAVELNMVTSFLAFSPDGSRLLASAGGSGGAAFVYDIKQRRTVCTLKVDRNAGSGTFSPDGATVALGTAGEDVYLYDTKSGARLGLPLRACSYTQIPQFSRDGRHLLLGEWDGIARVWDMSLPADEEQPFDSKMGCGPFNRGGAADGSRYLVAKEDSCELIDVPTGRHVHLIGAPQTDHSYLSPDGSRVAILVAPNRVRVWSATDGQPLSREAFGPAEAVSWFSFDQNGLVATVAGNFCQKWDAVTGLAVGFPTNYRIADRKGTAVAVSPDQKRVLMAHTRLPVFLDFGTGQPLAKLQGAFSSLVGQAAFSGDGRWVVTSGAADQATRVWHAETGKPAGPWMKVPATSQFAFSPDSLLLATLTPSKTLTVWDWRTGERLFERKAGGSFDRMWFGKDGRTLAFQNSATLNRAAYALKPIPIPRASAAAFVELMTSQHFDETETISPLSRETSTKNIPHYRQAWHSLHPQLAKPDPFDIQPP